MRLIVWHPFKHWMFIKRWTLHHEAVMIEYFHNLGSVSKRIYKIENTFINNYLTKDREDQIKKT